jgi:hypothetical protein
MFFTKILRENIEWLDLHPGNFSDFLDILKYVSEAVGASTPVDQSDFLWLFIFLSYIIVQSFDCC